MKKLGIGVRVRYIGGQTTYYNAVLYLLIGRTGIIKAKSAMPDADWFVEMDEDSGDDDLACPHCRGDGRDPMCDYLLPCPLCQSEQYQ